MRIQVVSSVGNGNTLLSAFDNALFNASVHNFNLIYLSSVIPPGSNVEVVDKAEIKSGGFGDRLYVVHSDIRSDIGGRVIAAGVGWYQFDDGRGLFVEHTLEGDDEQQVEKDLTQTITDSLKDLCITRSINFIEVDCKLRLSVVRVSDSPTCALVLGVYEASAWSQY